MRTLVRAALPVLVRRRDKETNCWPWIEGRLVTAYSTAVIEVRMHSNNNILQRPLPVIRFKSSL